VVVVYKRYEVGAFSSAYRWEYVGLRDTRLDLMRDDGYYYILLYTE
jgi:hypothetical protein